VRGVFDLELKDEKAKKMPTHRFREKQKGKYFLARAIKVL